MARTTKKNETNYWQDVIPNEVAVKGTAERFSLNWYGAIIHGCRIVKGKNGSFIGWPSFKGRDGKYIRTAYVYDGNEAPAADIEAVEKVVNYFS